MEEIFYGTGKRKTSIAKVWMRVGDGKIIVNKKPLNEHFPNDNSRMIVKSPLSLTDTLNRYDLNISVAGGGITGQASAIKHGISKTLLQSDPNLRLSLKRAGFLTRDSRIKERKKYGQKGARKKFQFSKR
jgi:small subunit ribosomal protein S9